MHIYWIFLGDKILWNLLYHFDSDSQHNISLLYKVGPNKLLKKTLDHQVRAQWYEIVEMKLQIHTHTHLLVQSCGENAVPQELGCGWQQFGEAGKRQSLYLQLVSQSKSPTTFFFMVLHHMMVGRDLKEGEKEGIRRRLLLADLLRVVDLGVV